MPDPSTTPTRQPPDDALAWELAKAAHLQLSRVEADRVYIAIGIGETFDAIEALDTVMARDRISLGKEQIAAVAAWLDCYRGREAEPRLRELLAEVTSHSPQRSLTFEEQSGAALTESPDRRFG